MKLRNILCFLIAVALFFSCEKEEPKEEVYNQLTIGSFNIEWLGDGVNDLRSRDEADYKKIAEVIENSSAELIGLQEIENGAALDRVADYLNNYEYEIIEGSGDQNLAVLYKSFIEIEDVEAYEPIQVEPYKTRPGLTFKAKYRNFDWIGMVVHFKSTSRYDSTEELKEESRLLRNLQAQALNRWIDSLLSLGGEKDIIVVGDFNDYPDRMNNPTLTPLVDNEKMIFLTDDIMSCKYDYLHTIDHIYISISAKNMYQNQSVRCYNFYNAYPEDVAEEISDHCPVLAEFETTSPDND